MILGGVARVDLQSPSLRQARAAPPDLDPRQPRNQKGTLVSAKGF